MNAPRAWRALSLPLLLVIGACSTGDSLPAANASTAFRAAPAHSVRFVYQTLVDPSLGATYCLGIDNRGTIAGFVRDRGVKGVRIIAPYQANDFQLYTARTVFLGFRGDQGTYGFHIGPGDLVTGFTRRNGLRTIYREDKSNDTEVTGIFSDNGVVGFYVNKLGADVAFRLIGRKIAYLSPPSSVSAAATGVNRFGDIVGWTQSSGGSTSGWLLKHGRYANLQFPRSIVTQAFGINDLGDVVGDYTARNGSIHGFIAVSPYRARDWQSIDNPRAASGATTATTGINNERTIVGWYADRRGHTVGFIAAP